MPPSITYKPVTAITFNTPAPGTCVVLPPNVLWDNTKTLIVLNMDSTNSLWVKVDNYSPAPASINQATSTVIPAGSAFTFDIGPVGDRGIPSSTAYAFYFQSAGGGAVTVNVTGITVAGYLKSQG